MALNVCMHILLHTYLWYEGCNSIMHTRTQLTHSDTHMCVAKLPEKMQMAIPQAT